jgi:hypothetical protein
MDYRKIKETIMKATKRVLAYRLCTRMLISLSREPAVLADESRELANNWGVWQHPSLGES